MLHRKPWHKEDEYPYPSADVLPEYLRGKAIFMKAAKKEKAV